MLVQLRGVRSRVYALGIVIGSGEWMTFLSAAINEHIPCDSWCYVFDEDVLNLNAADGTVIPESMNVVGEVLYGNSAG